MSKGSSQGTALRHQTLESSRSVAVGCQLVNRLARSDVKVAEPVTPTAVGWRLSCRNRSQVFSPLIKNPDPACRRYPYVAALIGLQSVRSSRQIRLQIRKNPSVPERAVALDIEHMHVSGPAVSHV